MISVDKALKTISGVVRALPSEVVHISDAGGRTLAEDVFARHAQPPFNASAMDGYAVRWADVRNAGATLRVVGESRAGPPFGGRVLQGEAVRIFTGAVVPDGADHVVMQEAVRAAGDEIVVGEAQAEPANIRRAGLDVSESQKLKSAGERLSPMDLALLAAANAPCVSCACRPVVAFFDNGDELVDPGAELKPGEIVGSIRFALEPLIREWGGEPKYLGRAGDDLAALKEKFEGTQDADLIITLGGASVGDHDFMRDAFAEVGGDLFFNKVAVRPGKPTWFGAIGERYVLGLPGNPASALVCALLFARPLIDLLSGRRPRANRFLLARLADFLEPNGQRESYLRATLSIDGDGRLSARAFPSQDSSLLAPLAASQCLIRRMPDAAAAATGDTVECLPFTEGLLELCSW